MEKPNSIRPAIKRVEYRYNKHPAYSYRLLGPNIFFMMYKILDLR